MKKIQSNQYTHPYYMAIVAGMTFVYVVSLFL